VIESEVLEPYRQRSEKLQRYEQIFTEAIRQQYPLSKSDCNGLKRLQEALRLRDEDVAPIERKVVRQRQRFSAVQLLTRQQFLKLAGLGGAGFTVAMVFRTFQGNLPHTKITKELPLEIFDFDVVTVNGWGKETSRKQAKFFREYLDNEVALEMVSIPSGKFLMGSPDKEAQRIKNESPQHSVTVATFFLGKFAVTQSQWKVVAGFPKVNIDLKPDPSNFKGAKRPVEQVSWDDAVEFCARLSKQTGRKYRLPSEAEWEYACRAGTTTPFHFGKTITTDLANYDGNYTYGSGSKGQYRNQTTDIGSFPANAFGLYDMHGNVWEWCEDTWHENYNGAPIDGSAWLNSNNNNRSRLLRGGSWVNDPEYCRCAFRSFSDSDVRNSNIVGFRIVCAVEWTS
jgi:formylglycine-generating enzyme required for sulfatase activity